jgi:D-alanyl-D-alanine carboxypeptidase/D-alanyl-D-alanine-endopeptidase (penicillin-binding protein 4)
MMRRCTRRCLAAGLVVVVVLLCLPALVAADLPTDIKAILRDKYLAKVQLGIAIAKLGDSAEHVQTLYELDSDQPLIPASNLKLLTTSAFLDHFGGDFKFRTVLLQKDQDLYLIGDGDPTLGDAELLKKLGWESTTVFKAWADELKKRGVTSVRNVVVDDSVFDENFIHPHWLTRYANERYSAQVGGVNFNANCVDFYVRPTQPGQPAAYVTVPPDTKYISIRNECVSSPDKTLVGLLRAPGKNAVTLRGQVRVPLGEPASITIHDPSMFAATTLAETIARSGISVSGSVQRNREVHKQHAADPNGWSVVAALDTKLSTVLDRANKDSMNLYAEALCKRLGHDVSGGQPGSWENGPAAIGEFLKKIGVPETQFHLDDGCGLSRENNVSADALLKVLTYNFASKNKDVFFNSLAVAGSDGTFENRFQQRPLQGLRGRVFGKSGYVNGVSALSGYLKARDEHWYAFSILMNNCAPGSNGQAKQVQEQIIAAIDANASGGVARK